MVSEDKEDLMAIEDNKDILSHYNNLSIIDSSLINNSTMISGGGLCKKRFIQNKIINYF